jgi:ubiquinone/menaquinone biosynthesis C-methylase UbiE
MPLSLSKYPGRRSSTRAETPWQLRLFRRTLKKKLRLSVLKRVLGELNGQTCLLVTCGDNNGAMNHRLRDWGGRWSWADCEQVSIAEISQMLNEEVKHVDPSRLPYADSHFDCVVAIDVHEHVQQPDAFTREMQRILKPGGRAVITVPSGDQEKLVNRLKNAVGMTRDKYGHVRDGFSVLEVEKLMRAVNIEPRQAVTFSRFFTEMIELAINYSYVKKLSKRTVTPVREGTIAPATAEQLRAIRHTYRIYSMIYPLVWLVSQLDWLVWFTSGYVVLVEGTRRAPL